MAYVCLNMGFACYSRLVNGMMRFLQLYFFMALSINGMQMKMDLYLTRYCMLVSFLCPNYEFFKKKFLLNLFGL